MAGQQRILIVDDEPCNVKLLTGVFKDEYDLQSAPSGEAALELIGREPPDLVLLDIMMPGMDGFEVCRKLKEDGETRDIPVVFVSVLGDVDTESKGLQLGAADYVSKPINVALVRQRIRNLLERELLRKALEAHRDQLEAEVTQRTFALSIAKEAAEAANRAKSAFLANMSHELRTPMNAILGLTALIQRKNTDARMAEQLEKIGSASRHLLNLINTILDYSKIEAERLSLEDQVFSLREVVEAIEQWPAWREPTQTLKFDVSIDPALATVAVCGDPRRLGQILRNLIGNAMRFTPAGSVSLRVRQVDERRDRRVVRFDVTDTGIGISAENQARIFDAFEQADGSPTRSYGGAGLGLSICKRLVQLMGGEIGVESRIPGGVPSGLLPI